MRTWRRFGGCWEVGVGVDPVQAYMRYRFALYSRADKLGLAADRGQPVALYACRATAEAHGRKLYGALAEVVELPVKQDLAP